MLDRYFSTLYRGAEMAYKNMLWISTAFSLPTDCNRLRDSYEYAAFILYYRGVGRYNSNIVYDEPKHLFDNPCNIIFGAIIYASKTVGGDPDKLEQESLEALKELWKLWEELLKKYSVTMPLNVKKEAKSLGLGVA